MNNLDRIRRLKFINRCIELRPSIKFQVWDSKAKDLSHYTFNELKEKGRISILNYCNQLLRYSIETDSISEFRIDIDKSLSECIDIAKEINNKLMKDNIKVTFYSSGGKGLHGHFLFNINQFKLNNNDYNLERPNIKKLIAKYYEFENQIDVMLHSTIILLGLEGGTHRKTNKRKILININEPKQDILNYIELHCNKVIINENYFNEINELSQDCIKFVNNKLQNVKSKPLKEIVKYNVSNKVKSLQFGLNRGVLDTNYRYYTLALIELYKKHQLNATHSYEYYLFKLFNDLGLTQEQIINEIKLICNKLNIENTDDLQNQYNKINFLPNENYKNNYLGFKHSSGNYADLELITLVEKLKYNIPLETILKH